MARLFPIAAMIAVFWIAGCSTQKDLVATGGSRADGTVALSYDYGMFEAPHVDLEQGTKTAASTCEVWGYTGANAFGGDTRQCQAFNGYGSCIHWLVTRRYQCTGAPSASNVAVPAPSTPTSQAVPPKPSEQTMPVSQSHPI
jgi:hypothetical protein